MTNLFILGLLWVSGIGCGLVAGLYFAFSAFIMTAFGQIGPAHAIAAMTAINTTILRSLFMPLFFGTTLAALLLAILAIVRPEVPGGTAMLLGGIIYVLGMFAVTMAFNVPLNTALAAVDPKSAEAASVWSRYLNDWTFWNHVRTIASGVACVLFIAALTVR